MGFISELCMCCQWQLNVCFSFHVDRAIRHRACSLRDMAQALLKAELDPEFERLCHEITQSRKLRGECLCQHVHSPENPGLPVFVATWTVQKTQRWVSVLPLTPSRELGGECLCRHVHSRELRGECLCRHVRSRELRGECLCRHVHSRELRGECLCRHVHSRELRGECLCCHVHSRELRGECLCCHVHSPDNSGVSLNLMACAQSRKLRGRCLCYRVCMVFEGLWKFEKNGKSFSRPWKSVKTEWGLCKFVNLWFSEC